MPSIAEQVAWAAGLFEGEGWFTRHPNGGRTPVAAIRSTDRDTIERFRDVMGVGNVREVDKGPGNKTQWHWQISGFEKVRWFADLIGPWLLERRRAQLERVLHEAAPEVVHIHERQLRIAEEG